METIKQEKHYVTFTEATRTLKLILCNEVSRLKLSNYMYRDEDGVCIDKKFDIDITYEYYLTDINTLYRATYLTEKYGLEFAYSKTLNLWILLSKSWSINWDKVKVEVKEY